MRNDDLLFTSILDKNRIRLKPIKINNKWCYIYKCKESKNVTSVTVKELIRLLSEYKFYNIKIKFPIILDFSKQEFADKLTWVLIEKIVEMFYVHFKVKVTVKIKPTQNPNSFGCRYSRLLMNNTQVNEHFDDLISKYEKYTEKGYYRRVLSSEDDKEVLSIISGDIELIINQYGVSDKKSADVAEAITEIIDNATEHGKADCLIDLDIADVTEKGKESQDFVIINFVVYNFSNNLLGTKLEQKIQNNSLDIRHKQVKEAYNNHSGYFDKSYKNEDFYMIAAFQEKITSRDINYEKEDSTGGKGLTSVIKTLSEVAGLSEGYSCYLITGERVLYFKEEYCKVTEDGWIGFNLNNNFLYEKPDLEILQMSATYFPGIAYNLVFVLKKGV